MLSIALVGCTGQVALQANVGEIKDEKASYIDELKSFKLDFSKQALALITEAVKLLSPVSDEEVPALEDIDEFENDKVFYRVNAESKNMNKETLVAEIIFEDDFYSGRALNTFELTFNLQEGKLVVLSEEAKQVIGLLIEEYPIEEIEDILNKSVETSEKIFLLEGGDKQVTIGPGYDDTFGEQVILWCQFAQQYPEEI